MKYDFPKIMGILNVTPDSFSDGGKYTDVAAAVEHAHRLIMDGADIIDVGGESTRPGAAFVPGWVESERIIPVIEEINKFRGDVRISVDTRRADTAWKALNAGADIINDISGLTNDENIARLAGEYKAGLIIMHMNGTPENMQQNPVYHDVVREVFEFLESKIMVAKNFGVKEIFADVGIGFGKTYEHNIELLKNLSEFTQLGVPLALGISRKSFIGKITGISAPDERDLPSILLHALLLDSNVRLIRLHNTFSAKILKDIYQAIK